jgi:hypothetical protein
MSAIERRTKVRVHGYFDYLDERGRLVRSDGGDTFIEYSLEPEDQDREIVLWSAPHFAWVELRGETFEKAHPRITPRDLAGVERIDLVWSTADGSLGQIRSREERFRSAFTATSEPPRVVAHVRADAAAAAVEQPPIQVNVSLADMPAPVVNVAPAKVTVNPVLDSPPKTVAFKRDRETKLIVSATVEDA